jgi:hypothetical protein
MGSSVADAGCRADHSRRSPGLWFVGLLHSLHQQHRLSTTLRPTRLPFTTLERAVISELHGIFRPELIGRFDEKIVFKPLCPDTQRKIALLTIALRRTAFRPRIDKTGKFIRDIGFTTIGTDRFRSARKRGKISARCRPR